MPLTILIRGGGDLSSGVAYRLVRAGWRVIITELPSPLCVRRLVAFSEAVYSGKMTVEGIDGILTDCLEAAVSLMDEGKVPVMVDPQGRMRESLYPQVIVDGRMTKLATDIRKDDAQLVIGLGPGFVAGENCHAVVETKRGPYLGRVYWQGSAEPDSGEPDTVGNRTEERVLRAPASGEVTTLAIIGTVVEEGQAIAEVAGEVVRAPFKGLLRGLIHSGLRVEKGVKIGDIDPRIDPRMFTCISDKALAMGGSVLEAILSVPELRPHLWD
jgi:xanthine dehydrogenase accessory factor